MTLLLDAPPAPDLPGLDDLQTTTPGPSRPPRSVDHESWPWIIGLLTLIFYVAVAIWMLYGLHYEIGDALARSVDARYVLFSRDPHLAAVGFVWLPLPVIGQLPAMLVLSPFGQAVFAGPLSTAFAGALTVVVVAKVTRALGLSLPVSIAFTVLYAFNPVVAFTAGNGMSESWFFLTSALAILGFARWTRSKRTLDLALIAFGLAGAMTVRYEALAFVPVVAAAAALQVPGLRRRLTTTFTIAAPAAYLFVLWLIAEYVIERDPFFWLHVQSSVGHTPQHAVWLPHTITLLSAMRYASKLTVELVPAILVIAPMILLRRKNFSLGLGLLASAVLLPALIVLQLLARVTWADPRYFEPSILFVSMGAAFVASPIYFRRSVFRRLVTVGLLLILGLGWVTGTISLSNPRSTNIEQEHNVFGRLIGRSTPQAENTFAPIIPDWRALAKDLDQRLADGRHEALLDASVAFPAYVFSRHPNRLIVSSDRDYLQIISSPEGRFDYLVVTSGPESATFTAILQSTQGGRWKMLKDYDVATLYQWIPTPNGAPGAGVATGTSN